MAFEAIPSAISSPASAFGHTPFVAPAGPMIDLFGRVPVRANLSPRQAKELGLMTSGTSGRPGTTSSASAALGSGPIAPIVEANSIKVGDGLYCAQQIKQLLADERRKALNDAIESIPSHDDDGTIGWLNANCIRTLIDREPK